MIRVLVSPLDRGARRLWRSLVEVSPFAIPLVFLITAGYLTIFVLNLEFAPMADSTADWLAAMAARSGLDPYVGVESLATEYGVRYQSVAPWLIGDGPWIHPRTPGALLLLAPLTYVSPDLAYAVVVVVSLCLLGTSAVILFPVVAKWDFRPWLLISCVLAFSAASIRTLQFGSLSLVIAALIWTHWVLMRTKDKDSVFAGIALGLAGTIKLFPLFLLWPAILGRKWKAVLSTVITFAATNAAGIVLFDISALSAWQTISAAGDFWIVLPSNASLVPHLTRVLPFEIGSTSVAIMISAAGGALVWWGQRRTNNFDIAFALSTIVMLLAAPLSWISNDVMLFLVVVIAWSWNHWLRYGALVWVLMAIGPAFRIAESGSVGLAGRMYLLAVFVLAAFVNRGSTQQLAGYPLEKGDLMTPPSRAGRSIARQ